MNKNTLENNKLKSNFEQVAQQQQALIAAIFPPSDDAVIGDFDPRGIAIYRNNLLATAQQALAISFPTVLTLIGKDLFNYTCRELLITSPPKHGDWALWGESYPTLLSGVAQLSDYPFVADIAQIDWFRQQSMRAKDSLIDQTSLQLLATHDIDGIYIELTPSQFNMNSSYPVIELWFSNQPHLDSETTEKNKQQYLTAAIEKLTQSDFSQKVLIYRPNFNAEIRELPSTEYYWLTLIKRGVSIGKALEMMAKGNTLEHDFDFPQWMGQALEQNLIRRLKV
jgi:hypothetical protein